MHLSKSRVHHFQGNVFQYSPKTTRILIYHCRAFLMEFVCKESFFGSTSHHKRRKSLTVNTHDCLRAIRTHISPYGRLHRGKTGRDWKTMSHDHFSCSWMKTKRRTYSHFLMSAFEAQVIGDEHLLQQHLTRTKCRYTTFHCTPIEFPNSKMAWQRVQHDSRIYHSIGTIEFISWTIIF